MPFLEKWRKGRERNRRRRLRYRVEEGDRNGIEGLRRSGEKSFKGKVTESRNVGE